MIKAFDVQLPKATSGRNAGAAGATNDIRTFLNSNYENVEIDIPENSDVKKMAKSYRVIVSRMKLSDKICVSSREGRMFLIRK